MAGNLTNTLYAPLISSFMKAFVRDNSVNVYFSVSALNSIEEIQKIHVTLVDQKTNTNALQTTTGTLIFDKSGFGYDATSQMYFVTILPSYLKESAQNKWKINQYYKLQVRFDTTSGGNYSDDKTRRLYLQNNKENFSEWSSVCLLRPISQPTIEIKNFEVTEETLAIQPGLLNINGKMIFEDSKETETLQSYIIELFDATDLNTVLYSTGTIFTSNLIDPNTITQVVDFKNLPDSIESFVFRISATTKNQYTVVKDYDFQLVDYIDITDFHPVGVNEDDPLDETIRVHVSNERGTATFRFINTIAVYGILYIQRSSSLSNFKEWESIYEDTVSNTIDLTVEDPTIGSHVWYKYAIQLENSVGGMSNVYYTETFFPEFYDAFLFRQDTTLPMRYGFQISDLTPVVNRTKIDTLGGKYPKFAENAILNYKQFSISGIISAEADLHQQFITKKDHYGADYNNYTVYLAKHSDNIQQVVRNDSEECDITKLDSAITTTAYDYFWEREFREVALKWLNDGEPKLFKSMTEGILPVMLMNVKLTPHQSTSRMLYDFSATMYEVGNGDSIADLESLGIINIPKVKDTENGNSSNSSIIDSLYRTLSDASQLYTFTTVADVDLFDDKLGDIYHKVTDKYTQGGIHGTRKATDITIRNVQIFFNSEPRIFDISNGKLVLADEANLSNAQKNQMTLGYSFQIKTTANPDVWEKVFVNSKGYYQIPNHIELKGIKFDYDGDNVSINYVVDYHESARAGSEISSQTIEKHLIGQYLNMFAPNDYLGEYIRLRYGYQARQGEYEQFMQYWTGISLDVTPFAVVYIKYNGFTQYQKYEVGHTGILHLLKDVPIDNLYFVGIRVSQQPLEKAPYLNNNEFVLTGETVDNLNSIKHPLLNNVYVCNGQMYIYYNNAQWEPFILDNDGTGIIQTDVEGAINYVGNVIRVTYT